MPRRFVVGRDLERPFAKRLREIGEVVVLSELDVPDSLDFPAGVIEVRQVAVDGDTANVQILLGPIPKPPPGRMILNCGELYDVSLTRDDDGDWQVGTITITVC